VAVTEDLRVAELHVLQGDAAVLKVADALLELAGRHPLIEVAHDPWRCHSESLRLERDHGLVMDQFPQSHAGMTAASERLRSAVVEKRLRHRGEPELARHVAGAVARQTGRGWRLDKSERSAQVDAVIALAMCVERAQQPKPAPAKLLGWL
jgi:phage terminase large subunit-like protein